ncbi:transcription factor COE4-like [Uloborus diversus]|uniref:transcription factor COE4-like n=1 Tax=Uloborus diversus TaxID=327109 RepID=UPI002409F30C|nr:transcription factor COE4-like [Uloborus diversus]
MDCQNEERCFKFRKLGSQNRESLYIRLVDSKSYELIRYEGQDGNPNMKRVLLTHESVCSRCNQNRSCGNKNETPSDPTIIDKHILKFFLKCNQNCLKGAGNPRDNRRFRIAVSVSPIRIGQQNVLAYSDEIFVHNNSKHSKKRKSSSFEIKGMEQYPKIDVVAPEKGHTLSKFVVAGENFIRGVKIYIDEYPVETEMLNSSPSSSANHTQLSTTPYHNASYNRYHSFYSSSIVSTRKAANYRPIAAAKTELQVRMELVSGCCNELVCAGVSFSALKC